MQFKKLQLVGFKTFADRTEIELGEGLTAVVGPNGSGKSNIADALLWVLGEQNPRLLRGNDSRDVIFAGTDRRKPLGMAQVTLTVDNTDGSLPISFTEVSVTRRIYRSGESDYLLNGASCRLKDIVELFLDTGMGKGAYAFVSQSEVDSVLSARPEDRRELFEEAAGIKKYRVKKREAVRKLEQAEANLTRVRDIIHELEQQREPLARQAQSARRYLELSGRLRQIEVDLLVGDVKMADYELYAARRERALAEESLAGLDAETLTLEKEAESLAARLEAAERASEDSRERRQRLQTETERTESRLQLLAERGRSAEQAVDSLTEEIRALTLRASHLLEESESLEADLRGLEAGLGARNAELTAARRREGDLEAAVADAARRSEDSRLARMRLAEERAQRDAALESVRNRLAETRDRLNHLVEEGAAVEAQAAEALSQHERARERVETLRASTAALSAQLSTLNSQLAAARDSELRARTSLDAAQRLLAERASRLSTLTELQESGEGFYQGVRAVLKAARDGKLRGFYAPAVELLTVPEELRVAVEVALGATVQDIVCETEEQARAAIEWLKSTRSGRATFLPLPLLRPGGRPTGPLDSMAGVVGVAADLVTTEPRFHPALQLLLGRVVIARDMECAIAASRKLGGWSRIVTLQGELLTPGGALTGGSLQGKGAHLVGRKGEIDDLRASLAPLRSEIDRLSAEVKGAHNSLRNLEGEIGRTTSELSLTRARLAGAESESAASGRDAARLSNRVAELAEERARHEAAEAALREHAVRLTALAQESAETAGSDNALLAVDAELAALRSELDAARRESTEIQVHIAGIGARISTLRSQRSAAQLAREEAERSRAAKQALKDSAVSRLAESAAESRELETRLSELRRALEESEAECSIAREALQAARLASSGNQAALRQASAARAQKLNEIHQADLQITRHEMKLAQASQRLQDEYGISPGEALALPEPETPDRATINEAARLRRDIRAMGNVNTGAAEEYERLTERHDFLAAQRDDLEQARESLLATIAEIDESTRGVFMETFEAVAAEFTALFSRLFGGGATRLILTNPDDLLETGIEVIAQPPGKKPQQLSLLSGGERALTAVAFLFSFLAVRPSPFCLLDEVDAPLDGPNVEKFVELVRDFSARTQFLVITHNPTTMEASPRWYGVTMPEPGVSRVLAYRLPEEALVSEAESVERIRIEAPG